MRRIFIVFVFLFLQISQAYAQQSVKFTAVHGVQSIELLRALDIQKISKVDIKYEGESLVGKNFKIFVRSFIDGNLEKTDLVFDSHETDWFKVNKPNFTFSVYTQHTADNKAKINFYFENFHRDLEYALRPEVKEFALKDFLGSVRERVIPINVRNSILTVLTPYVRSDGSTQYCEVAGSGVSPEELGKKYAIPHYLVIDFQFED